MLIFFETARNIMAIPTVNLGSSPAPSQSTLTDTQVYALFDRINTQPSAQDKTLFNHYICHTESPRLIKMLINYILDKSSCSSAVSDQLARVKNCMMQHVLPTFTSKLEASFRHLETARVAHRSIPATPRSGTAACKDTIFPLLEKELAEINEMNAETRKIQAETRKNFENGIRDLDKQMVELKTKVFGEFHEDNLRMHQECAKISQECREARKSREQLSQEINSLQNQIQEFEVLRAEDRIKEAESAKLWRKDLFQIVGMAVLCAAGIGAVIAFPFLFLLFI